MKKALLAIHIDNYNSEFSGKSIGDFVIYNTERKSIIEKLLPEDEIYIRLMDNTSNKVVMICSFIELVERPKRHIKLQIKTIRNITAGTIYRKFGVKVGAEHGWLK